MATTIKIDGVPVVPSVQDVWLGRLDLARGQISTLTLQRYRKLPAVPESPPPSPPGPADSLMEHEVQIEVDGVGLVFTGDVVDEQADWTAGGWATTYQARCLRNRGDWIPLVDDGTRTTTASYNRPASDLLYLPDRSGKTVGDVIADVLTMDDNAAALHALGIGGYASMSPPTLPAETLADLAALDRIPPQVATVSGDKLLSAVAGFLEANAINHDMIVRPDGVIRFLDRRQCVERVVTLDDCDQRASLRSVRRSVADCRSAVELWGRPRAEAKMAALTTAGLVRAYGHSGLTPDQAEATWTPDDFLRGNRSIGTCTVADTLHVTVDPADPAQEWTANAWSQGQWRGMVVLTVDVIAGVASTVTRRVVANTALSAGGTCVLTLDEPLPATDYTRFELYGDHAGAALVYRRYRVADPEIRAALARKFSVDATWTYSDGRAATTTSYPMASVVWSDFGGPPYSEATDDFTIDGDGYITFARPTYLTAGGRKPHDVKVLLAVNVGSLTARAPATGHEGTAHGLYGLERPLRKYVKSWTDPGNQAAQDAYARELLDAVKDVTVDVSVEIGRLWAPAFDFGNGLSVAAAGHPTGLEGANLPIRSVSLAWNSGKASLHTTTVQASNRREAMQPDDLVPPERQRQGFGFGPSSGVVTPFAAPAPGGRR
jgi:hypothetical protein